MAAYIQTGQDKMEENEEEATPKPLLKGKNAQLEVRNNREEEKEVFKFEMQNAESQSSSIGEISAIRRNLKEQKILEKELKRLEKDLTTALRSNELVSKMLLHQYDLLQKRIAKLKTALKAHEFAECRRLDAQGRLNVKTAGIGFDSSKLIALANRRLNRKAGDLPQSAMAASRKPLLPEATSLQPPPSTAPAAMQRPFTALTDRFGRSRPGTSSTAHNDELPGKSRPGTSTTHLHEDSSSKSRPETVLSNTSREGGGDGGRLTRQCIKRQETILDDDVFETRPRQIRIQSTVSSHRPVTSLGLSGRMSRASVKSIDKENHHKFNDDDDNVKLRTENAKLEIRPTSTAPTDGIPFMGFPAEQRHKLLKHRPLTAHSALKYSNRNKNLIAEEHQKLLQLTDGRMRLLMQQMEHLKLRTPAVMQIELPELPAATA